MDRGKLWQFCLRMKKQLDANEHKGGWESLTSDELSAMLIEEVLELREAIKGGDSQAIIGECADVANFAYMIADNAEWEPKYG